MISKVSPVRALSTVVVAAVLIGTAAAGALTLGDRSAADVAVDTAAFYGVVPAASSR